MPALPAAIAAWAAANATAIMVAKILVTAALIVNGVNQARRQRRQAKAAWEASLKDRLLTIRSATQPRTIVYGRARVGGVMIRKPITSGSHSEFLHVQLAIGGHPFDAIEDVWFDDESIGALDANGWVTGGKYSKTTTQQGYQAFYIPPGGSANVTLPAGATVISVYADGGGDYGLGALPYSQAGNVVTITGDMWTAYSGGVTYRYTTVTPYVRVQKFLGSTAGERDTELESISAGVWKATHLGKGVPRLHVTLRYNPDMFPSGLPQVTAIVRGKRVYDTRDATTKYSNNVALCARDYIVDPLGLGESGALIDEAAVSAAANVCDESVPTWFGSQSRYACDGALSTGDNRLDNLGAILTSMVGTAIYSGGVWIVNAGAYSAPVMDLTDADLADGPIELITETPTRDLFNAVRGKIIDAGRGYQEVDVPPYVSAAYGAEDGGTYFQDLTLPMTTSSAMAQRIMKMILHLSRQSVGFSAWFKDKAARLRPGDTIRLSVEIFGQAQKVYRVIDRKFEFPRGVQLTLQETGSAPYSWTYTEALDYDPTPNTTLPDPRNVTKPANLAVSTVLKRRSDGVWQIGLKASWDESTDVAVLNGGEIIVEATNAVTGAKITTKVSGDSTEAIIAEAVGDREVYHVRAQAYNGLARSDWTYADPFTVAGPEDPPEPVPLFSAATESFGVRLIWNKSPSFDVVEYEILVGPQVATATPIGNVAATTFFWQPQTAGTRTFWIRAIDAWGNKSSAVSTTAETTVPAPGGISMSVDGDSALITWGQSQSSYQIEDYEIRVGAAYAGSELIGYAKALIYRALVLGVGVIRYWIAARDVAGNVGTPASVDLVVSVPATPSITYEVVDNFVLLRWQDCKTTLPVDRYEVYRGSTLVGDNGDGRFSVLFEQAAGNYTYGVIAYDSADNPSAKGVVVANVSAPPDYVLRDNFDSDLSGAIVNGYRDSGLVLLPLYVETDAQHTTRIGYTTDSAAAGAGLQKWWQPGHVTSSYTETFDITLITDPSTITVTPTYTVEGAPTIAYEVKVSTTGAFAGEETTLSGVQVYAGVQFRYVRVKITVTGADGDDLFAMQALNVKVATKLKTESGVVTVTANPTTVTPTGAIQRILSISLTPAGTTGRVAVYDYTSGTTFKVHLFNSAGAAVTGDVAWTIRGV